jgi:hypothetical protein
MRTIVDPMGFSRSALPSDAESVMVELDGSLSSAESLWRMVLAMAQKDHAWCIQYDVNHPARLIYVTEWQVFGLVPPPDEMAEVLVRAIDQITRPKSFMTRVVSRVRSLWANRVTRSVWVKHDQELVPWVASWPRRASNGPVVLFRETYPGPDPDFSMVDPAAGTADINLTG